MTDHGDPNHAKDSVTVCLRSCKPPFGITGKPCVECAADYAEWLDFLPLWTRELARCRNYARAIPATDQEWADYLDQVAPVVNVNDEFTFIYFTATYLNGKQTTHAETQ